MKRLVLNNIFFLIALVSVAQSPGGLPTQQYNGKWQRFGQYVSIDSGVFISLRDTSWLPFRAGALTYWQGSVWDFNGTTWQHSLSSIGTFNGNRPITRDFSTLTGVNLGTLTTATTLNELLYPAQPPTATLSGGVMLELMATGPPLSYSLPWTAGRQSTTDLISTITVAGVNKTFTQPAQNASVSGSQTVAVTRNLNTTYSNVVVTMDGKSATATTNFIFSPKRYFGWVNTTSPIDAEILSVASEFSTSNVKSWIQNAPNGPQNLMFAYPANEGALVDITINGFPSLQAFELSQKNFTNASGYSQTYYIYASTNKFTVTGTTTVSVK